MRHVAPRVLCLLALLGCGSPSYGPPAYAEPEPEPPPSVSAGAEHPAARAPSAPAGAPADIVIPSEPAEPAPSPRAVTINGRALGEPELHELEAELGHAPEPGRFWYDARSGLWGLFGHGAGGVTRAGVRADPLPSDASAGASAVLVNGREITPAEVRVLARLLGWPEPKPGDYAGRYVLESDGQLYGPANRYLGNLQHAAERIATGNAAECAWLHLGDHRGALGLAVTVACD